MTIEQAKSIGMIDAKNSLAKPSSRDLSVDRPTIFSLNKGSEKLQRIKELLPEDTLVIDNYSNPDISHESWMADLYKIEHPLSNFRDFRELNKMSEYLKEQNVEHNGCWVYRQAWGNRKATLEHLPKPEVFTKILYSRNFNAIEPEVQKKMFDMKISVAGLSVGSNILEALVRTGIGTGKNGEIRLADRDRTSAGNLQRLMGTGTAIVDMPKTESMKHRLWEINPYVNVVDFSDGVNDKNLEQFAIGADAVIEVVDNFPVKYDIRNLAQAYGIPVLMPTDLFGKIPIQIEKNLPGESEATYFQGRLTPADLQALRDGPKSLRDAAAFIVKIVGIENMPTRNLADFREIFEGKKNYFSQPFIPCLISASATTYYLYEIAKGNLGRLAEEHVVSMEDAKRESTEDGLIRKKFIIDFGNLFLPTEKISPTDLPESVREVQSTRLISRNGIDMKLTEYKDSVKELEYKIGPMQFKIEEVPSEALSEKHPFWKKIQEARKSYYDFWFDNYKANGTREQVGKDIFDGIDVNNPFKTYHYIATVSTPTHQKILTMRKLFYPTLKDMPANLIPEDVAFWEILNKETGQKHSLRDVVLSWAVKNGIPPEDFSISAISRSGTNDIVVNQNGAREQGESGLAFAGIQILALDEDKDVGDLIFCMLCDEFKEVALAVNSANGYPVQPRFTSAEDALNLRGEFQSQLNSDYEPVRALKAKAGGYFMAQNGLYKESMRALQEQEITPDDVLKIARRIFGVTPQARLKKDLKAVGLENETIRTLEAKVSKDKNEKGFVPNWKTVEDLLKLVVLPRNCKYMSQLIEVNPAYKERLIKKAGDGPYSSVLKPDEWRESAWKMIEAAYERYKK